MLSFCLLSFELLPADFNEDCLIDASDMNRLLDLLTGGAMEQSLKDLMIEQVINLAIISCSAQVYVIYFT